jgi:ATP-dependent HslUV protease ATP-binding subunit HslU
MRQALGGAGGMERRHMSIGEARPLLIEHHLVVRLRTRDLAKQAIKQVESDGIVFLDEIDKICAPKAGPRRSSADASDEGVQRDLLPLVEGTTVSTPQGPVQTDHILFICSGAFHKVNVSDMLPELQGRLPIRVELQALTEEDFYRILTVPTNNLIKQQVALLSTDNVVLEFDESAVREVARVAFEVNRSVENIGARRLNTVIQRVMDEHSFTAADQPPGTTIRITVEYVRERVKPMLANANLSRFVL